MKLPVFRQVIMAVNLSAFNSIPRARITSNYILCHLVSPNLTSDQQRRAAHIAAFDFEIKYRSRYTYADALSGQHPPGVMVMLSWTVVPKPLQQALGLERVPARQTAISALPRHTCCRASSCSASRHRNSGTVSFLAKEAISRSCGTDRALSVSYGFVAAV